MNLIKFRALMAGFALGVAFTVTALGHPLAALWALAGSVPSLVQTIRAKRP